MPKKSKSKSPTVRISRARWAAIDLFAMDVDGILTDGTLHISSDGTEAKVFSVLDGMGLGRLRVSNIKVAWISGRLSGSTAVRAAELKIPHLIQGRIDKLAALQELTRQLGLKPAQLPVRYERMTNSTGKS